MKKLTIALALLALSASAFGAQTLTVDDDGRECPGALSQIQAAVDQAGAGDTILVCSGVYLGSVVIRGHEKDGLQLVARDGDVVVIQGNHTEANGVALIDVDGVLVRGLTIRDFGTATSSSPDQDGVGEGILLLRANDSTIESNEIFGNDMTGILVVQSNSNTIHENRIYDNEPDGTGRGIQIQELSARNVLMRNRVVGHPLAGILLREAGVANEVLDNDLDGNGRYGLANLSTSGTRVESNRASNERGLWSFPGADQLSYGIYLGDSSDVDVRNLTAFANGMDVCAMGSGGRNTFRHLECGRSCVPDVCSTADERPDRRPPQY
jgi:parallel beta-helix repeat protein